MITKQDSDISDVTILASSSFSIYCCHNIFVPFLKFMIAVEENNEFWRYLIMSWNRYSLMSSLI